MIWLCLEWAFDLIAMAVALSWLGTAARNQNKPSEEVHCFSPDA